jgi:uncharacterized membrane protein YbhN (UPF0104 family)
VSPKRVLWIAGIAAVLYAGFAYWVVTNFEIPRLRGAALAIVIGAAGCQIAAKWFFGLLFRESVQKTGSDIRPWSAFKAALVAAGVARLIPAGGAITPVALSWTVRDKVEESTAGPGIRTVLLNYAGLLIMAGAGVLLERPGRDIPVFEASLLVIAPLAILLGLALMFGSGRLGSISKYLPGRIRDRIESSMINHLPGWQSQVFIWTRLLLEASVLWLVLHAFGIDVGVMESIAVYAAAQLVGGLPGMPGGLLVTEGALAILLAAYGYPAASTVTAILVYRVVSYWLPAGLSFAAGGSTFLKSEEARAAAESG